MGIVQAFGFAREAAGPNRIAKAPRLQPPTGGQDDISRQRLGRLEIHDGVRQALLGKAKT